MKRTILLWLLTAALLCGCAVTDAPDTTQTPASSTSPEALPEGYYAPDSPLERQTGGAVRVYPLDLPGSYGIAVMGEDVLVFSGGEESTQLTLLRDDGGYPAIVFSAETRIDADSPSTQVTGEGISYYMEERRETVILDEALREITRISAPEGAIGAPVLSEDRMTMYYSAAEGVYALDLDSGIPRLLRRHSGELTPEAVLMEGALLQCGEEGRTLFLSTETGQLVREWEGKPKLVTSGENYMAAVRQGGRGELVFGTGSGVPRTLRVTFHGEPVLLAQSNLVLDVSPEQMPQLNCYELSTGTCRSVLMLEGECLVSAADGGKGIVWLLDGANTLYRWDTNALPSGDSMDYSDTYNTRARPDLSGIAQCQELAKQIGERHGVEILVWEDALEATPWDYRVTEEYQVPILTEQLRLLDRRLGNFPEGFLAQLSDTCSGLTICLVRSLEGGSSPDTVEAASGVQYWVEDHAYIALSTVSSTEGGLYHELCHVIDTRVFAESNAYDQWEELNPSGFQYDYDYAANAVRNAGEYLRDAERCFIDTYSMSFPKEDRARVLEYAMTPGNEHFFQSEVMQAKLMQVCLGLREAFGLKKSPDTFLWEQYLKKSLAYGK